MRTKQLKPHYKNIVKLFDFKRRPIEDDEILEKYLFDKDDELINRKMSFTIVRDDDEDLVEPIEVSGTIIGVYRALSYTFYVVSEMVDDQKVIHYVAINAFRDVKLTNKETMLETMRKQIKAFVKTNDFYLRFMAAMLACAMIFVIVLVRIANRPEPLLLDYYNGSLDKIESTEELYDNISSAVVLIEIYSAIGEDSASATGMIISDDGYLISCAHIYSNIPSPKFMITLNDGTKQSAVLIAGDTESDVALFKITRPDRKYPTVKFADSSNLKNGEECVVLGFPGGIGVQPMLTKGVISSTSIQKSNLAGYTSRYIQTDATANPGNSGGGLFNMNGLCVGIVTSKYVDIHYDNTTYSVPSQTIKKIVNSLYYDGHVARPTLGIAVSDTSPQDLELGIPFGSKVATVEEYSNAHGKLNVGDIITKLNGVKITPTNTLIDILSEMDVSNLTVVLEVFDPTTMEYRIVEFKASVRLNSTGVIFEVAKPPVLE